MNLDYHTFIFYNVSYINKKRLLLEKNFNIIIKNKK